MNLGLIFSFLMTTGNGVRGGGGFDPRGFSSRLSWLHYVIGGLFTVFLFILIFTFRVNGELSLAEKTGKTKFIKRVSIGVFVCSIVLGILFLTSLDMVSFHL